MKLSDQIKEDIKAAMKNREPKTLDVLRMLSSSIKYKMIEAQHELEDAEVIAVVRSDMKKLQDALADFTSAAREDLVEKTKEEIEILKKYLPPEMSDEELERRVKAKLEELGVKNADGLGKAIGAVMADLKGLVEGSRVKKKIEEILK